MGTNGLIAVADGEDFVGVFQWLDAHPHALGNRLLLDVLDASGDLEACAAKWVHDAPEYGWQSVFAGARDPSWEDEPSRWRKATASEVLPHVAYTYLLDVEQRTLSVYGYSEAFWEDEPDAVVALGADGRGEPGFFSSGPGPLPPCPVDISPLEPDALARARRLDGLLSVEVSMDRDAFYGALSDRLETALDSQRWPDPVGEIERELRDRIGQPFPPPHPGTSSHEIRVHSPTWSTERARSLAVGRHTLLWPVDPALRHPFPQLVRSDGHTGYVPFLQMLELPLRATWIRLQEQSAVPGACLEAIVDDERGLELFRFYDVVADADPSFDAERHLTLSAAQAMDPSAEIGDSLGTRMSLPRVDLYALLDQLWWVRQSSRRGRFRLALS